MDILSCVLLFVVASQTKPREKSIKTEKELWILKRILAPLSFPFLCPGARRDMFKGCLYKTTCIGHLQRDNCNPIPTVSVPIGKQNWG